MYTCINTTIWDQLAEGSSNKKAASLCFSFTTDQWSRRSCWQVWQPVLALSHPLLPTKSSAEWKCWTNRDQQLNTHQHAVWDKMLPMWPRQSPEADHRGLFKNPSSLLTKSLRNTFSTHTHCTLCCVIVHFSKILNAKRFACLESSRFQCISILFSYLYILSIKTPLCVYFMYPCSNNKEWKLCHRFSFMLYTAKYLCKKFFEFKAYYKTRKTQKFKYNADCPSLPR